MTTSETSKPTTVFAPARVDLSAGFTDVRPLCDEAPGRILNTAIGLGVLVTASAEKAAGPTISFVDRISQVIADRLEMQRPRLDVSMADLPAGSGLGSSGALSIAVAYVLSMASGAPVDPSILVDLACTAERDIGLTGGTQDQLASMHGGAGLVHRGHGLGHRTPVAADLAVLGKHLVLVHRSGSRNSGSIIEHVLHERPRVHVARTIATMNHVAEEMTVQLAASRYDGLAALMNESTTLLRELHPGIVDHEMYEQLRRMGAQAAKPCGAGGPGAVWAILVDPMMRTAFIANVEALGWSVLRTHPSASGAHVLT